MFWKIKHSNGAISVIHTTFWRQSCEYRSRTLLRYKWDGPQRKRISKETRRVRVILKISKWVWNRSIQFHDYHSDHSSKWMGYRGEHIGHRAKRELRREACTQLSSGKYADKIQWQKTALTQSCWNYEIPTVEKGSRVYATCIA